MAVLQRDEHMYFSGEHVEGLDVQNCTPVDAVCKSARIAEVHARHVGFWWWRGKKKKRWRHKIEKNRVSNILVYFDLNDYAVFIAVIIFV